MPSYIGHSAKILIDGHPIGHVSSFDFAGPTGKTTMGRDFVKGQPLVIEPLSATFKVHRYSTKILMPIKRPKSQGPAMKLSSFKKLVKPRYRNPWFDQFRDSYQRMREADFIVSIKETE